MRVPLGRLAPGSASRSTPRLPRAAAAPAAQKQSPSQGSHRRAPPAPPLAAAALRMLLAPLGSTDPLLRPGSPGERHGEPGAEASGSRGASASDCSTAAPYSSRAGRSEPPRGGHPEDARVPIASHGGATAAATVTARVTHRPCRTARSRRSSRRRVPD